MRMPRALVDSSTMGAETTAEKNCAPEGLPVEEAEHLRRLLADRGEQRMAGL